jgi:hypothetical protein
MNCLKLPLHIFCESFCGRFSGGTDGQFFDFQSYPHFYEKCRPPPIFKIDVKRKDLFDKRVMSKHLKHFSGNMGQTCSSLCRGRERWQKSRRIWPTFHSEREREREGERERERKRVTQAEFTKVENCSPSSSSSSFSSHYKTSSFRLHKVHPSIHRAEQLFLY